MEKLSLLVDLLANCLNHFREMQSNHDFWEIQTHLGFAYFGLKLK